MKILCGLIISALLIARTIPAQAVEKDFVVQVLPASILIETQADSFEADAASMDTTHLMPNVAFGVGLEFDKLYLDLTGGGGAVLNTQFQSTFLQGNVAVWWQPTRSFNFGPRLGVMAFLNPQWIDDADVEFDETIGWMAGLQMAMGDKITYLVSFDIMSASFDATAGGTSTINDDNLDIMGVALQFGVRGIF